MPTVKKIIAADPTIPKLKWKKNADIAAPLMEYLVAEDRTTGPATYKMRIKFAPHKMKSWVVEISGASSVFFEGTRSDVKKMQLAAEAMYVEWEKTNKPTAVDRRAKALEDVLR